MIFKYIPLPSKLVYLLTSYLNLLVFGVLNILAFPNI